MCDPQMNIPKSNDLSASSGSSRTTDELPSYNATIEVALSHFYDGVGSVVVLKIEIEIQDSLRCRL